MGRVAAGAIALALLLGATACGERSEPTGSSAKLYPVTIQSGDRPFVVKAPAKRIDGGHNGILLMTASSSFG